jgi:hypothetical protein
MTKEYFKDVRKGDPLMREAWSANAYNRRSRALQHDNNYVRGSNNHYITTEAFHGYWTDDNFFELKLVRLKKDLLPPFLTEGDQSTDSSLSSKVTDDGTNAVVLQHNGIDWADSDPPEEIYVADPFHLPYDRDDRHWVMFHPVFGQWVIIDRNTIRVAKTCKDDDGTYPKAEEEPNVYPIEFVTPSYKAEAGRQESDYKVKSGNTLQPDWMDSPHAYCLNLWDNYPDSYIPSGTPIWCFWQFQQWYTHICCGQTDEMSSGSSSSQLDRRDTYTMRKTDVAVAERMPGGPYLFEYKMSEKTPEEKARSGSGQPDEQQAAGQSGGGTGSPGPSGGGPSASVNALVVQDIDLSPSVDGITTLQFDQADGFVITQSIAGTARLDFTIPNDTVTYAMIQNVSAASRVLGRGSAAGSGDTQELTLTYPIFMLAGTVTIVGRGAYLFGIFTGTTTDSYVHITNGISSSPLTLSTGGVIKVGIRNTDGSDSLNWKIICTDKWGSTETLTRTVAAGAKGIFVDDMSVMTTIGRPFASISIEVISTSAGFPATYDCYVCGDA